MAKQYMYIVTERSNDDDLDLCYVVNRLFEAIKCCEYLSNSCELQVHSPDTILFIDRDTGQVMARIFEMPVFTD